MLSLVAGKFGDWLGEQYADAYGGSMSDAVNEALNPQTVSFFGLQVNPALYSALGVSAIIIIACILLRIFYIPRLKKHPKGFQLLLEGLVGYFDKNATTELHRNGSFVGPYVFTAAVFIALGTLVELLGFRPAFSSVNTCLSFGIMTFLIINFCGFREKGVLGRIKRYANPVNIITDLSVPVSLSFRLFGSIMSGFIIVELVYTFIYTSFVLPVVVSVITTLFHAFIQSYLFATLSVVFMREAIE